MNNERVGALRKFLNDFIDLIEVFMLFFDEKSFELSQIHQRSSIVQHILHRDLGVVLKNRFEVFIATCYLHKLHHLCVI
jgi:hypothetical protein